MLPLWKERTQKQEIVMKKSKGKKNEKAEKAVEEEKQSSPMFVIDLNKEEKEV